MLLVSLLPIIVYLFIVRSTDTFSLVTWKRILCCMAWGVGACLIVFAMSYVIPLSDVITPLVEELLKGLPLLVLVFRNRIAFLIEAVVMGVAVVCGFAFTENSIYLFFNEGISFADAMVRGVATSLMHLGCTSINVSVAMLLQHFLTGNNAEGTMRGGRMMVFFPILSALVVSGTIHVTYNLLIVSAYIQILLLIIVFLCFFYFMGVIDEKIITRWLDSSLNEDITLLAAFRAGHIADTQTGRFLKTIQERVSPETFFDIYMMLSLYWDLSIQAKSGLMLRESGLNIPLTPEQRKETEAKLTEFLTLKKSIGLAAIVLLTPVMKIRSFDAWVIKNCLSV